MKIDKNAVAEIALGVLAGGLILLTLHCLFGGWLASQGAEITGYKTDGSHSLEKNDL